MNIQIKELECYIKATEEQKNNKHVRPESEFKITNLKNKCLRVEMEEYILMRGKILSLSSVRTELTIFNQFSRAMNDILPDDVSITDISLDDIEKECRKWLMKNNLPTVIKKKRPDRDSDTIGQGQAPLINYVRAVHSYFVSKERTYDYNDDIWDLEKLDIRLSDNPVIRVKTISFKEIKQKKIREEIKRIIKIHLKEKALGTVTAEMASVKRFTRWLQKNHPEIETLEELTRDIIEEYLTYINLEATERKDFSKDLFHLKSVLKTYSLITEDASVGELIINSDIPRSTRAIYKSYSDDEIRRLNKVIMAELDEQLVRAIRIHQLLGTRISETLTLKKNNIIKSRTGKDMITIYQIKSRKTYEKLLTPNLKSMLEEAIAYTEDRFGEREYIFVNDKEPDKPMTYEKIKYAMNKLIRKYNLRDDHGERFTVGTHIWRHTYAKKLAEMDIDDMTIATLLGQSGISSLKYYRRIEPETLAEKTEDVRMEMNDEITKILEVWEDERRTV